MRYALANEEYVIFSKIRNSYLYYKELEHLVPERERSLY